MSLLLMRDLELLGLILTITILCFLVLAATQPRRRADADQDSVP